MAQNAKRKTQEEEWQTKKVLLTAFSPTEFSESAVLYTYLKERGCQDITAIFWGDNTVKEKIPKDIKTIHVDDWRQIENVSMDAYDIVFRHTFIPPSYLKNAKRVVTSTQIFFENCPAKIIGVTGTKGKGTTCSLIAEILQNDNKTVHLVGNIGVPALEVLPAITPDDIVVFELSSFQLWDLEKSPHTAVVLMIEPDHMDVHVSMEEYVGAKANIAKHQDSDDLILYHPNNRYAEQIAQQSPADKKQYMTPSGAYIIGGQIVVGDVAVAKVEEVSLVGGHNLENVCAAITATWEHSKNVTAIQYAIKDFKGLPHRLELVRELDGVQYFNDSYSSAPGATIAAIRSFTEPEVLICGGFDRGLDYTELAQTIAEQKNMKKVVLIGQTKEKIAAALDEVGFSKYEVLQTTEFTEIIAHAQQAAQNGDIILLSPGCASFDMFKNFQERGEQFRKIVGELA